VLAKQLGPGHRIVTVLCDSGMRLLQFSMLCSCNPGTRHLSRFWSSIGEIGDGENLTILEVLGVN
jgi:hypothetical protein